MHLPTFLESFAHIPGIMCPHSWSHVPTFLESPDSPHGHGPAAALAVAICHYGDLQSPQHGSLAQPRQQLMVSDGDGIGRMMAHAHTVMEAACYSSEL